jgi:hypothetical protein
MGSQRSWRLNCCLLLIFVFLVLPLSATTYYIDNCVTAGSDSNNGTSTSTPWLTVAKVNGFSFFPGDTVKFRKTCSWNEVLNPSVSGSDGSPITFDAYGSGANPQLTPIASTNVLTIGPLAYLIFNNLTFLGANGAGITITDPGASTPANNLIFNNVVSNLNGSSGVALQYGSNHITISNSQMDYNGVLEIGDDNGISIGDFGVASHDITIDACDIGYNYNENVAVSVTADGKSPYNITVSHSRLHHTANSEHPDGFHMDGAVTGAVVYGNLIYANSGNGLGFNSNTYGSPRVLIYGNTICGNGTGGNRTDGANLDANVTIKNNIFCSNPGYEVEIPNSTSVTSDYNDFYHTSGNSFSYNGTPYITLEAWRVATKGDMHSMSANPLLLGRSDFRLDVSSPAIDAGVNLGPNYQMALNPDVSTWFPGEVNRNNYGTGWAIGAYVYDPSRPLPPTNLRATPVIRSAPSL